MIIDIDLLKSKFGPKIVPTAAAFTDLIDTLANQSGATGSFVVGGNTVNVVNGIVTEVIAAPVSQWYDVTDPSYWTVSGTGGWNGSLWQLPYYMNTLTLTVNTGTHAAWNTGVTQIELTTSSSQSIANYMHVKIDNVQKINTNAWTIPTATITAALNTSIWIDNQYGGSPAYITKIRVFK